MSSASRSTARTRWRSRRWSAGWSARASTTSIQNYSQVKHDLLGSLFSGSGLVWYGGVIGGAIAVIAWARLARACSTSALLDLAAVPLAMGYAIGRIGCQVSGDGDYGKVSSLPWAMGYPHGTVPTPPGVKVQPTPIYETLAMGLVAWWLWRMRDRFRPGALFAFYLLLSGLERLLVEFIRRNHRVALGSDRAATREHRADDRGRSGCSLLSRRGGCGSGAGTAVARGLSTAENVSIGVKTLDRGRSPADQITQVRARAHTSPGFGTAGSLLAGRRDLFVLRQRGRRRSTAGPQVGQAARADRGADRLAPRTAAPAPAPRGAWPRRRGRRRGHRGRRTAVPPVSDPAWRRRRSTRGRRW